MPGGIFVLGALNGAGPCVACRGAWVTFNLKDMDYALPCGITLEELVELGCFTVNPVAAM